MEYALNDIGNINTVEEIVTDIQTAIVQSHFMRGVCINLSYNAPTSELTIEYRRPNIAGSTFTGQVVDSSEICVLEINGTPQDIHMLSGSCVLTLTFQQSGTYVLHAFCSTLVSLDAYLEVTV